MTKIPVNPLVWFKKKKPAPTPVLQRLPGSAIRPAKPKKSGNIFMYLTSLQKKLESVELSLRQEHDCMLLMQEFQSIVLALQGEAVKVEDDDIVQGTGQILAYLETVVDGRLDFDEEGVSMLLDFILMFKDNLGDGVSGIRGSDTIQFTDWNDRYQALMARMRPMEEGKQPPVSQNKIEEILLEPLAEIVLDVSVPENGSATIESEKQFIPEEGITVLQIDAAPPNGSNGTALPTEAPSEEKEEVEAASVSEEEHAAPGAVNSSQVEASAGELQESDEEITVPESSIAQGKVSDAEMREIMQVAPGNGHNGQDHVKNPVQLEEVERLKKRLLELREKQGMLSISMGDILGDLNDVVESDQTEKEPVPVEILNMDEIENLIFIGRKKG